MPIMLTERAAKEVKKIMDEQKMPESVVLRVGVQGGGCSGFSYALGFDNEVNPAIDEVAEVHGIKVVVDRKSNMYLNGTEVDFYEGLEKRGFTFNNPNAQKSCGCGTSFQV
jgi:iron-sulfur cluster assembly accessory protein